MENTYWLKQAANNPLFPELVWSRPENQHTAGKLLIIGGNVHGFATLAKAYEESRRAGAGSTRILLPQAVKSMMGSALENIEFAPSTPSGSFSQKALIEFLTYSEWADGVLLAGEMGRNSETAILLEKFVQKYSRPLTITLDAADYFSNIPLVVLNRPATTLVLSLAQLQKLCIAVHFTQPITFAMDLIHLVETLHVLTSKYPLHIVVKHLQNIFVANNGYVSTTHLQYDQEIWRLKTAVHTSVWSIQNPTKPFEALTTAILTTTAD